MAYLGGNHCAMSPLFGVPVMHKYLRIVRKIESCHPPLEFGQEMWAEKRAKSE